MGNFRKHGAAPYRAAAIHGGPGAHGSMALVAREMSEVCGTLEPFQTVGTIEGQVDELGAVLHEHAELPAFLAGHSWGAWLVLLFAARHPEMVSRVVLVASGPYEAHYAEQIMRTRLERIEPGERERFDLLMRRLHCSDDHNNAALLKDLGCMVRSTDCFDALPEEAESGDCGAGLHPEGLADLMEEAFRLRREGELLRMASRVRCPVLAIHGDYDPHPAQGVQEPLSRAVDDFRFVLLEGCGHEPWNERHARDRFFEILRDELREAVGL